MLFTALRHMFQMLWLTLREVGQSVFLGIATLLNPALAEAIWRPERTQGTEAALEVRLEELSNTMARSAELVAEVEAALEVRQAAVAKLKSEAETAQRVAELSEEHRNAVATLLRGTVAKEGKKTFWLGALVNLFFFVAGVVVTLLVGK
ncbi:hypothetical protein SK854_21435 [Lentzea sp. BCCO 10_0061]|uniref:Uncharacterized protein n=1 Tax=Lentzea sokolovensis TaxID=3095429 RepID=A0ABU4V0B5_9PSEU|nr:hypothetical protein [Lentzea sp. BCCO 10_0061]MDX8144694.1 hypothetical protein [Lentzea sp. BCCO 10_0061]